mmetsp:Transcript_7329/g.14559  ORF Transcript_7329/g.14559 Transcript_7329/m.14559 type:complete len:188 (+) Transcript_7329:3-566(+)
MALSSTIVAGILGLAFLCTLTVQTGRGISRPAESVVTEMLDPAVVRYSHSKVFPHFSCGRSVRGTMDALSSGAISPSELPQISVMEVDLPGEGKQWISLNNRRLWVLKECRELNLIDDNKISCRIRQPETGRRAQKHYNNGNFSLSAKLLPCKQGNCTDCGEKLVRHTLQNAAAKNWQTFTKELRQP